MTSTRSSAGTTAMVAVRETRLAVRDVGTGPALLFIHGMCGDAQVWSGQVRRLSDRFRCVSYDRRGHSRSRRGEEPESVRTHVEDAAALITTLGLRPVVVGSSSGGRITVELARRHPDLLAGVVVSEPPIMSLAAEAAAYLDEIAAVVEPAVASGGPRAGVDAFFALVCPGLWSTLDEVGKDRYRANAEMMLAELAGPRYELSATDLPQITVNTLVVAGAVSHPAQRAIARVLADGLPHTEFLELAGSGHVTYAERPDEFARAVAEFASALPGFAPAGST